MPSLQKSDDFASDMKPSQAVGNALALSNQATSLFLLAQGYTTDTFIKMLFYNSLMAIKDQKPNAAIAQQNLRLARIAEIKKILKRAKGISNADIYLMVASKYRLSLRKASEYARVAQFQMLQ